MGTRPGRLLVAVSVACLLAAFAGPAGAVGTSSPANGYVNGSLGRLSADQIARLAAQANQRSIIILKNQHSELPARPNLAARRARTVEAEQARIKDELRALRARDVKSLHIVNAVSATISGAEAKRLARDPAVRAVVPDRMRPMALARAADAGAGSRTSVAGAPAAPAIRAAAAPADPSQQICPSDPSVPLLEPEALQAMHVEYQPGDATPAAHQLVDGSGVKVGIIADGLDPNQPDLVRNGQSIVYDYRDFSGYGNNAPTDGREAFLDAGAIAAQGNTVYDLSTFVNPAHPLPAGCNIRIKGVAPGATLAVMNVSGPAPGFFNSQIIQAIEWAVNVDRVDVLNESLGGYAFPDSGINPIKIANDNAQAAGVTVVVSTGDSGPTNTIQTPSSDPGVIAVGGTTTFRVYRQTTRAGSQLVSGGWQNDNITALSSAGTAQFGPRTVDVVAPGDRGWSLCSPDLTRFFGCADIDNNNVGAPIWAGGGTSLSAPLTSGTAALVIHAYASTHNGARPAPDLVKRILMSTAQHLGAPAEHQGAGLVDSLKAVQLAQSVQDGNGTPAPVGNTLLTSKTSLVSTVAAGTPLDFQFDVTNTGSAVQDVSAAVVSLGSNHFSDDTGTVNLSDGSPTFVDDRGRPSAYAIHQFDVPGGADYLNGDILWNAQEQAPQGKVGSAVFETLWDPAGNIAGYSLLSGPGRGHVEVRKPAEGTWTAAIFTVKNSTQYTGEVRFSYFTQQFGPSGTATPATQAIAPGQTAGIRVSVAASSQAGDRSATVRLSTGGPGGGSLPVVVRSLVPMTAEGGSFQGALSGGGASTGQQFTYQFDVPEGKPSLDVALALRDPHNPVIGVLVDPSDQPLGIQSTRTGQTSSGARLFGRTMQFFQKTPAAGRWALIVRVDQSLDAVNPDSFSQPFSGTIGFQPVPVTVNSLPNSASTVLPQGSPARASIRVTNTGNSAKDFFVDPRLAEKAFTPILSYGNTAVPLPLSLVAQPYFYVPPSSDLLFVAAQGTVSIVMDTTPSLQGPDYLGTQMSDNMNIGIASAPELAPNLWFALPEAQGPTPPEGIGNATVDLSAAVNTNSFDTAVSSSTGNAWMRLAIDNSAPYSPLTLNPGESGTITLTLTPNAPRGTVVSGFVEVETYSSFTTSGDEIAVLPYTYTVG